MNKVTTARKSIHEALHKLADPVSSEEIWAIYTERVGDTLKKMKEHFNTLPDNNFSSFEEFINNLLIDLTDTPPSNDLN